MNVSSISSGNNSYQASISSEYQQRRQDFKALQNALQQGDLSGAQSAFASLQSNISGLSKPQNSSSNANSQQNQAKQDFQALQTALQSGDLTSAQKAFATLQQDMKTARASRGHHHHRAGGASATNPESTTPTSTTPAASNPATEQVTEVSVSASISSINLTA